ncbi:MAG TPA: phosphoglucosamine mutase [Firmicutes bacterium]|jgi:phosphoglucosamine mutase|nr:phosphoglucosamine mutase [Bacillota bacterium]
MERLFGTDGVRGIANQDLTPELAYRIGRASAAFLGARQGKKQVLVGRDTRRSGTMLEAALAAGICSVGVDVFLAGVIPTPAVAYLVRADDLMAGFVISASHNPAEYNGIKLFGGDGFKLPDEVEDEIAALVSSPEDELPRPTGATLGQVLPAQGAHQRYIEYLTACCPIELHGKRFILDCAHGAATTVAPQAFRNLGAEVIVLNDQPDGLNINAGCGSTDPSDLQRAVLANGADAGFAFDGDADRVIAVDERGQIVDGDQILAICGTALLRQGRLPGKTVVATVMSNIGLELALRRAGIELLRTKVGDRYVLEAMEEKGYGLGGEQSGHIIFRHLATTGDGTLSALQLSGTVYKDGQSLAAQAAIMERFPQVLVNVQVKDKEQALASAALRAAIAAAEQCLAGRGRVLVRPSGTEPLVRVMVEGPEQESVQQLAEQIAAALQEKA